MDGIKLEDLRRHYQNEPFDESHLESEPILQFKKWFEEAAKAEEIEPNAMALATVSKNGAPSLRMVLLKGLEESGLVFYTNYESRKGRELADNPNAALLFWWQTLERQVRIEGTIEKVSPEISDAYFQSRPGGSQIGAIVSPQSRPIHHNEEIGRKFAQIQHAVDQGAVLHRPGHWGGYVLKPVAFEFWQGRENRLHDRFRFELQDSGFWTYMRLAP
jgi:pyridoxamine 5'-phosphate oxidase